MKENNKCKNNGIEVERLFKQIFENMYGHYYEREYMETISNFSLRTVMQYLKAYSDSTNKGQEINTETKKAFIQKNKDIFLNGLMNFGLDLEFFDIARGEKGIDYFIYKVYEKLNIEDISYFIPNSLDANRNIVLIIIPQYLNLYTKPYHLVEWGVKIILPLYLKNKNPNLDRKDIGIDKFTSLFKKLDFYVKELKDRELFLFQTYRRKEVISEEDGEKAYKLIEREILESHNVGIEYFFLTLPYVEVKSTKTQIDDYFSPLYILAFNEEILNKIDNIDVDNLTDEQKEKVKEEFIEDIYKKFTEFINFRKSVGHIIEIHKIEENKKSDEEIDEESSIDSESELNIEEIKKFSKLVADWLINVLDNKIINNESLHIIEISKSFYHFTKRSDDKLKANNYMNVQDFLKTYLFSFINELMIVKIQDFGTTIKQIVKPNTAFQNFKVNLDKLKSENEEIYDFILNIYMLSPIIFPYFDENVRSEVLNYAREREINEKYINNLEQFTEKFNKINEYFQAIKIVNTTNKRMPKNMFLKKFEKKIDCNNIDETINRIKAETDNKKLKRKLPTDKEMKKYIQEKCSQQNNQNEQHT